jgi:hypothetical protein
MDETFRKIALGRITHQSISDYLLCLRTEYVFLVGKIIRSTGYVVMKLPEKYAYPEVFEKCLA